MYTKAVKCQLSVTGWHIVITLTYSSVCVHKSVHVCLEVHMCIGVCADGAYT